MTRRRRLAQLGAVLACSIVVGLALGAAALSYPLWRDYAPWDVDRVSDVDR